MEEIWRRRIRGRNICAPFQGGRVFALHRVEAVRGFPIGYRHHSFATIPRQHISSKVMQDIIEENMRRQIAREPAGPKRDFLIRDLELWIANGRPTAGNFIAYDKKRKRLNRDKEAEPVKTWRNKPLCADFESLSKREAAERIKKMLRL